MRPVAVVVLDELVDDGFKVTSAYDEPAIDALPANGAHESLGEGVGTRGPDRRTDGPNALGAEGLVEAGRELGVPVADQELDRSSALGQLIGQVSGLLDDPGNSRVGRDPGELHLAGVEFDAEQDVEPPQKHGVHREEVAGQHLRGPGFQELTPRRVLPGQAIHQLHCSRGDLRAT